MDVPCAIKIFKTSLNEFKNREAYIRGDWRYGRRLTTTNPRRFIAVRPGARLHRRGALDN